MLGSFVDVSPSSRGNKPGNFQSLTQIFELATTLTHVDHPLCINCLDHVQKEMKEQILAAEEQAQAYSDALSMLQEEQRHWGGAGAGAIEDESLTSLHSAYVSEDQLHLQLQQAEREEQVELKRAARLEQEVTAAERELAALDEEERSLAAREEEYWQRLNALSLELSDAVEERDALATKTDVAARHLDALRQTSVLEDCFHIWYDGPFGTISGFRLGRRKEEVKWEEVNCAWGQSVLLLDMMTRMYPDFHWSGGLLKPMASRPQVSDFKTDYPLFGPVSKMWSGGYDKAMMLFLSCLDAFARFARERDVRNHVRTEFQLPNHIDPERGLVRGHSIKYGTMVGSHDNWNKALKYMLVNLKVVLHWVMKDQCIADRAPLIGGFTGTGGLAASVMPAGSANEAPGAALQGTHSMFQIRR